MSCCTNTYDLGCFESCEVITSSVVTVTVTGTYTVQLLPTLADLVQFDRTNGQSLVIPNSFNELGISQFQIIDPNADVFTYTSGATTYDCFSITNKVSTTPLLIPVGGDCDDATATPVNSLNNAIGAPVSIASGGIANVPADDTTVTVINSAATTIAGPTAKPSGIAASMTVADITVTDSDGSSAPFPAGVNYTCTPPVKSLFLKGIFGIANDTMEAITIDADNTGTYTSIADDGASGVITLDINGGGFLAFVNPTTLNIADVLIVKRTITAAAGWYKITGTYV